MNKADFLAIGKTRLDQNLRSPSEAIPIVKYDKDGGDLYVYIGFARRGSATSEARWVITKLTYDANDEVSQELSSVVNSIWDDRASLTYT